MPDRFDYTTRARAIAISFVNLMNKKFGVGVLIPMMFSRYRNPREEVRIFMFMDLEKNYSLESPGQIILKGKDNPIEVFSIDRKK
jgi:hypothetical protein